MILINLNKRAAAAQKRSKKIHDVSIAAYLANPKLCEHCGAPIPLKAWKRGTSACYARQRRFCGNSCATKFKHVHASFPTKYTEEESREHRSISGKRYRTLHRALVLEAGQLRNHHMRGVLISKEQYHQILETQKHCAICDVSFVPEPHTNMRAPVLDHCHKTGKIGKMLCRGCNIGLGQFEDVIERLERAIEYLRANR
jgi:hypothetical protein